MLIKDKIKHVQMKLIKGDSWFGKFKKKYVIVTSVIVVLVLIILLSLIVYLSITSECNEVVDTSIDVTTLSQEQETTDQTTEPNLNEHIQVVSRWEWLSRSPTGKLNKLQPPVSYVIIMDTATDQCTNQTDCELALRHIQRFHIKYNKTSDINYNFLIGGDGFVYEGRGWKFQIDLTFNADHKSIGIAFIGTYDTVLPTQADLTVCKEFIEQGVKNGLIAKDYRLVGSRQVSGYVSPGLMLFKEIRDWPEWWFEFEY